MSKPIRRSTTTHKHENPNQQDLLRPQGDLDLVDGMEEEQETVTLRITTKSSGVLGLIHQCHEEHIVVHCAIEDTKALPDLHLIRYACTFGKNVFRARRDVILGILRAHHVNVQW